MAVLLICALVFGYMLGSIPFGLVLTKISGAPDPRNIGSHNIGATNVLRTGRKDLAAATLVLDALKGTMAVLVAGMWGEHAAFAAAFGAFLGHLYPVWLQFKGGKGVATFLGCLMGVEGRAATVFVVVWLTTAFATRYSSAGALAATLLSTIALLIFGQLDAGLLFATLTALLYYKHRENISRLMSGAEAKIGAKS